MKPQSPKLIPRVLSTLQFARHDSTPSMEETTVSDHSTSFASSTSSSAPKRPKINHSNSTSSVKLLKAPELFKESKKDPKRIQKLPSHQSVKDYYVPWYLQQSTKDLASAFREIQSDEDERLHEAVMIGEKSPWSLHLSAKSYEQGRSRYTNVFPWDKNRVQLPVISKEYSDYINASHINLSVPEISRFNRYYVATQGPTENTVPHFWQMCYHESDPMDEDKPIVIVMVTALKEHKSEKCYKYWPDGQDYDEFMLDSANQYDEGFKCSLRLTLANSQDNGKYVYSKLLLTPEIIPNLNASPEIKEEVNHFKPKVVHHFYYDKWSDFSKPDEYDTILELSRNAWGLNGDRNLTQEGKYNENPLYIHCSAGVGRSGTFITLDYLLNCCSLFVDPVKLTNEVERPHNKNIFQLGSSNADVSEIDPINAIVQNLRKQRMMSVQSRSQYLFVYDTAELVYQDKVIKQVSLADGGSKNGDKSVQ